MIAYSPLGSPRRAGRLVADPALTGIAQLVLSAEQRASVDERFHPSGASSAKSRVHRAQPVSLGDVVVVMGYPGAGKSTIASTLVADGYERLDRDERGGSLLALAATLDQTLEGGKTKVVLDNTYPSRSSRNAVVEVARRHGVEARCVWITTSLEDAQVNAVRRMIRHHGRLLSPAEMRASRDDPRHCHPARISTTGERSRNPCSTKGSPASKRSRFSGSRTATTRRAPFSSTTARSLLVVRRRL